MIGGVNFTDLVWKIKPETLDEMGNVIAPAVTLNYGNFLQVTLDFLIVAFAVFLLVKFINELTKNGRTHQENKLKKRKLPQNLSNRLCPKKKVY